MTDDDLTPEDQLRRRLRAELGDPEAADGDPAATPPGGWTAIEQAGDQRALRNRLLVGVGASLVVVVLVGALLVLGDGSSHQPSVTDAVGTVADQSTVPDPASTSSSDAAVTTAPGGTDTTAGGPGASDGSGSVTTAPVPPSSTVPEGSSLPPRSTTTGTDPTAQIDCGTRYLASGWPTTTAPSRGFADCILGAFETGTPAIYRERAQTDGNGGHIEITTYQVTGPHQVRRSRSIRPAPSLPGASP